jgi:hypothetical protein
MLWVDIKTEMDLEAPSVANYPIEWTVDSVPPNEEGFPTTEVITTNAEGRSSFPFKQSKRGDYKVTATMVGKETETQSFELTVIAAFVWTVKLIPTDPSGPEQTILPGTGQFELFRGAEYRLEITPNDLVPLNNSRGALGWSSDYTRKALGLEFDPPLAQHFTFTGDQKQAWTIKAGDLKNGTFQLGLLCDRLNEALILEGTLSKRPLPKRPRSV